MKSTTFAWLSALSMVLGAGTQAATALELRAASASPVAAASYDPMYTTFMSELEALTDGEITVRHIGLEVVGTNQVPTAISTGLVDVGNLLAIYFPADFPNMMLLDVMAPLGVDGYVQLAALTEYMVNCEDCQAEFTDKGLVYVNGSSGWPNYLHTVNTPVTTQADLQGLRVRSGGGFTSAWLEYMGAVPVNVNFGEIYEALQTGLVDGQIIGNDSIMGLQAHEVIKYATAIDLGTFQALASFTTRQGLWRDLTLDQREAYVKAAIKGVIAYATRAGEQGDEGLAEIVSRGGEVLEPSAELLATHEEFLGQALESAIGLANERYGVTDAEAKAAEVVRLMDKWTAIIEPLDGDTDAIAEAMWNEIWANVDLETYGL